MSSCVICRMQEADIPEAAAIWVDQNRQHCGARESFPLSWVEDTREIVGFLRKRVASERAVVARLGDQLLGYLAYDEFPFHGEKTVFCPVMAHGAVGEYREETYRSLYRFSSQEWVNRNVLNHMWTILHNDDELRDILYDLGFGSYVVDAFSCTSKRVVTSPGRGITRAGMQDVDTLCGLVEESRQYYRSAPLFLVRDRYSRDDTLEVVRKGNVFIAWVGREAVGFINVSVSQENNAIELSPKHCGLIDDIGIYIRPEYRGLGLGKQLLQHAFDFCSSNGINRIHVDFESANTFANRFWPKHFDPMLLSVRRTINKNINAPVM